jgi:hypothetical protein
MLRIYYCNLQNIFSKYLWIFILLKIFQEREKKKSTITVPLILLFYTTITTLNGN